MTHRDMSGDECTVVVCSAKATEKVHLTLKGQWKDETSEWGYCPEHIDMFAQSLRELGTVRISRI